ncbi:hypothetical protein [Hyphomicrobium sp. DY-1]|uniref:hypothetical protein n=1 Tax=Hyphomicrobium sp. DY-1 TaxID=3075650 RepID=UPI0039C482F0
MTDIDTRRLVHRVIGGREGFPALTFHRHPRATDIVISHARVFIHHTAALTHARQVHYIRKLAVYLVRRGLCAQIEFDIIHGSLWFHQHPEQLTASLSFGGAIRLQKRASATTANLNRRRRRARMHRDPTAPVPDKPILLAFDAYTLEKCTHPQHVIDAGRRGNNCLVIPDVDGPFPNARYWDPIEAGTGHLFTIHYDTRLVCILFIKHNMLVEMQNLAFPGDFLRIMPRCAAAIERHIGPVEPLHHGFLWPVRRTPLPRAAANENPSTMFAGDAP